MKLVAKGKGSVRLDEIGMKVERGAERHQLRS